MSSKSPQKYDAFRRIAVDILRASEARHGFEATRKRFKIGNRATLAKWLNDEYMSPIKMDQILNIANELNEVSVALPEALMSNFSLSYGMSNLSFLGRRRYCDIGEFVLRDHTIYVVESVDSAGVRLRLNKETITIPTSEKVDVLEGVARYFSKDFKPALGPAATALKMLQSISGAQESTP